MQLLKKSQKLFLPGLIHLVIGEPIYDSFTDSTKEVSKRLQKKAQQSVETLRNNLIQDLS